MALVCRTHFNILHSLVLRLSLYIDALVIGLGLFLLLGLLICVALLNILHMILSISSCLLSCSSSCLYLAAQLMIMSAHELQIYSRTQ